MKRRGMLFMATLLSMVMLTTAAQPWGITMAEDAGDNTGVVTENAEVNLNNRYQKIEGFGFFGAKDCWWNSSDPSYFCDDDWADMVINDLGMTMWRNELYPNNPVTSTTATSKQDGNWDKQMNTVVMLSNKAKESSKPFKVILTVWSPPGEFKTTAKWDNVSQLGAERGTTPTNDTKNGGTLNPAFYTDYANWLISGLDMYKAAGVDVYALSLQNEPAFVETYNSCTYTAEWYIELLKNVVPLIKAKYPKVKIFGSENMLSSEAASATYAMNFHNKIMKDEEALKNIDVFASHGYVDGVAASSVENHKDLWERSYNLFSKETGKPQWMTETSGYFEQWLTTEGKPGALELAEAINIALRSGKLSAWVMWQGSELGNKLASEFSIMDGTMTGKRYSVLKHFYKFLVPGAQMVNVKTDRDDVIITAFHDVLEQSFTSIMVNQTDKPVTVNLSGTGIPMVYSYYITNADATVDCIKKEDVSNSGIEVPAYSVVTLKAEGYNQSFDTSYVRVNTFEAKQDYVMMNVSSKKTLGYRIMPADATNQKVTFTSSDESIATVSENGVVTTKAKAGTCEITMTLDETGETRVVELAVKKLVKKIKLAKKTLKVKLGKTAKIKATVTPKTAKNKKLSYKSSNKKIVKVSTKGVLTGVKKGKATITVKAKDGSGVKATCKVNVVK